MAVIGSERLLEDVWEATSTVGGPAARGLLERVSVALRRSAMILRANGRDADAARTEQFALRVGLGLDEPRATSMMHALADAVYECSHMGVLLERALDGAMSLVGGDRGNIQIRNAGNGDLRIAAQAGFDSEFLEYFAAVKDESSACGRAASRCLQTVIIDVNEDVAFAPHREIAAASRFRAVQSTPLVGPDGRLRGVVSTHFRHAHRPSSRDLQLIQWYGERVAAAMARGVEDGGDEEREPVHAAVSRVAQRESVTDPPTVLGSPLDGHGVRLGAGAIDGTERDLRV